MGVRRGVVFRIKTERTWQIKIVVLHHKFVSQEPQASICQLRVDELNMIWKRKKEKRTQKQHPASLEGHSVSHSVWVRVDLVVRLNKRKRRGRKKKAWFLDANRQTGRKMATWELQSFRLGGLIDLDTHLVFDCSE